MHSVLKTFLDTHFVFLLFLMSHRSVWSNRYVYTRGH